MSRSFSFGKLLSDGVDATWSNSLGSCGRPDEASQLHISVPIVAILEGPDDPTDNIDFEFVIGGDFSSVIGDLCLLLFGVLGDVVFPVGISPLPAVTVPPADGLTERGIFADREAALLLYICEVNGFIDGTPLGEVVITCEANRGSGNDMGSTFAFR